MWVKPFGTHLPVHAHEVTSDMCGCLLRVKVFGHGGGTESTGAFMCPTSDAAGMAVGPESFAVRVPDQCGALGSALTDTVSLTAGLSIPSPGTLALAGCGRRSTRSTTRQAVADVL